MTSHDEFDDAAAAYALDALDPTERAAFELHLTTCERCQQAVAELRTVTAALGASVEPVAPPESLKARTMSRATAQPQAHASASVSRLTPRSSSADRVSPVVQPARRSSEWLVRAASIIVIVGLGLYASALRSEVATLRTLVAEVTERAEQLRSQVAGLRGDSMRLSHAMSVISAPDAVRLQLRGAANAPRATGLAFFSPDRGLIVAANQLPPLAPGRVYQLWVIPPGSSVALSGGVFSVDSTGALPGFTATLPAGVRSVKTIAITDEPGPVGSPSGTTPILLVGSAGD